MRMQRFGVSMEHELLSRLDALVERRGSPNRSEAIRDLVRAALVEEEWHGTRGEVIGILAIIYDHHRRDLSSRLLHAEHGHAGDILATLHIHLDHDNCLEVKIIRGTPAAVRTLADELSSMKGVKFGKLIPATAGRHLR